MEADLDFSISYSKDFSNTETIHSISEKKLKPLESPNIGFENGLYWFKVILNEDVLNKLIVFDLLGSNITKITVFQNSKIVPYKELDKTHFSLLVNSKFENPVYYLRVQFDNEVYFPLQLKTYEQGQLEAKYSYFINGAYYGFVLMVFIVNLFFYISLKDKTFLYYCFFLIVITIIILDYDGLLNTIIPNFFSRYGRVLTHFFVSFSGALFANQFLNINYYLPKSNKTGVFLLFITMCSYLLFFPTNKFLFVAIGDTFSMLVLLHYWGIGIIISKKYKFSRFFVVGYSLILFSSVLFIVPLNWGLNTFTVSLKTVKFGALFEMLILTYAITYRVKILQKENHQFKTAIQEYLHKINFLESNSSNPSETNIEVLVSENNLSEREADVLLLIFKGYTNKRIGDELFISLNTVKYHIRNIYQKLNIKSKNEAIDILSKIKEEV
ncbi:7TM diverse intracellular signaling domain-containing protein [Flavicella sediminum]|uniref:7TM diverse intracellular signaling domain-containing protein n=1 Tax=Flavicella sediminum TaxID=2585141 RepID=UPI0011214A3B|nr:7TM diverse intracellular signaling domain-containing protein [Flavicella sediminum]